MFDEEKSLAKKDVKAMGVDEERECAGEALEMKAVNSG